MDSRRASVIRKLTSNLKPKVRRGKQMLCKSDKERPSEFDVLIFSIHTSLLGLGVLNPALQIVRSRLRGVHPGHKQRCLSEEVPHLFQRAPGRLGQECPEEDSVGEVAHLQKLVSIEASAFGMETELTMNRMYHLQPMPSLSSRATLVVWPIMVLKAKLVMVAIETPLERVLVSKISAGIIHDRGPHVALNEKLYSQVIAIKPHEAPMLLEAPSSGGYLASRIVAMMKQTAFSRLPPMSGKRRPVLSMNRIVRNWANKA